MVQPNSDDQGAVVVKRKISTNFCSNILKVTVGEEKAKAALSSVSMQTIPPEMIKKAFSTGFLNKSHSLSEMGDIFKNKLAGGFGDKIKE